jgi:hypothetical protein
MATKVNVEDSRILREVIDRAYQRGFEEGRRKGFVEGVQAIMDRFRVASTRA